MRKWFAVVALALLTSCGGGSGGSPAPTSSSSPQPAEATAQFFASRFSGPSVSAYTTTADKVAEGTTCYIYLERNRSISPYTVNRIREEFDTNIYPNMVTAFGEAPKPGIDGDPKIYIVLLSVDDGFSSTSTSYVAGYFDPGNEYARTSRNPYSNEKEILFLNINPAINIDPTSTDFFSVIAHEFQHMIHWEQKTHRASVTDDVWLEEAMSSVSRSYCGYGTDYTSVLTYELAPSHSLTRWDGSAENYGVVFMWAQYFKDRVGSTIFANMLANNLTGIKSVNAALTSVGYPKDFAGTFRDWSVAMYSGNAISWTGHPEWSYLSLNTWPGTYSGIILPGLFPASRQDVTTLTPLDMWSVNFYSYTPSVSTNGSITWTPARTTERASFVDSGNNVLSFDLAGGVPVAFSGQGYLIVQNPAGSAGGSDIVVRSDMVPDMPSPSDSVSGQAASIVAGPGPLIARMNSSSTAQEVVKRTGKPRHVSMHAILQEREKELRTSGARPPF